MTEVFEAITAGDVPRLRELLAADPSLASARNEDGLSAVLLALYHRQRPAADALVDAGADIGTLEAAALGDLSRLQQPDLAARGADGFTPLHLAAFFGGADAVKALLAAGADPAADNDNAFGVYPINSAASSGDVEAVRALIDAGADPSARQRSGHTPLDAARRQGNAALEALLSSRS
jgi:ankyrin repeat protein